MAESRAQSRCSRLWLLVETQVINFHCRIKQMGAKLQPLLNACLVMYEISIKAFWEWN